MKKILTSVFAIAMVAAVAGIGSWAYFSDTEISTGNTVTAGTLDLKVNGQDVTDQKFTVENVYPGYSDSSTIAVKNDGTIDGQHLKLAFRNMIDNENGCTAPEAKVDGSCDGTQGELSRNVKITITEDGNTNPIVNDTLSNLRYYNEGYIDLGSLAADETKNITITATVPTSVGNIIQSDSVVTDIELTLTQN